MNEVNECMIQVICKDERVSYVEHLARRHGHRGQEVDTFVSHWWGEEFSKTIYDAKADIAEPEKAL